MADDIFGGFSMDSEPEPNGGSFMQDILDFASGKTVDPEAFSRVSRILCWVVKRELRRVRGDDDFFEDLYQEAAEELLEVSKEFGLEKEGAFVSCLFYRMRYRVRSFLFQQMNCSEEGYVGCFLELAEMSDEEVARF